jgi:CRP-like cAMP-binding protein
MALDDDVALLERVAVLEVLGRDALRILAIGAEVKRLKAGDTLFREGEDADSAYVVASGTMALKNVLTNGHPDVLAGPGSLIGETALITQVRRPATAIAHADATLLRIPRHTFLRTLEGYPAAAAKLQDLISRRLAATVAELDRLRLRLDVQGGAAG